MKTRELFSFDDVMKTLEEERKLLERIRQSIERCETIPKLDSISAINYHRPERRIMLPH